jgi:hypothetical protein
MALAAGSASTQFGGEDPLGSAPDGDNWHHEGFSRWAVQASGGERTGRDVNLANTRRADVPDEFACSCRSILIPSIDPTRIPLPTPFTLPPGLKDRLRDRIDEALGKDQSPG